MCFNNPMGTGECCTCVCVWVKVVCVWCSRGVGRGFGPGSGMVG